MATLSLDALPPLPTTVAAGRLPAWDFSDLIKRSCPNCAHDEHDPVCKRPDHLDVRKCTKCGMLFVSPAPSNLQLARFYNNYCEYKKFTKPRISLFKRFSALRNAHIAILMNSGGLRNITLLDVGCSRGQFLLAAQAIGAQVVGVDADEIALQYVRQLGLRAHSQVPQDIEFDVVTAFEFLEHVANPLEWLSNISSVMKSDGRLLLSMPNATDYFSWGESWLGFRVDMEHINYFSARSVSDIITTTGFAVEQFWFSGQPYLERQTNMRTTYRWITDKITMRFLDAFTAAGRNARSGTFTMTVLARKI